MNQPNNKQLVKNISLHPLQAYLTDTVQLFNIVEQLLEQIGTASLLITSFSISEEFVRMMYRLKKRGLIASMELVIDMRAAKKIVNLMPFANNVFDNIHLASNHSKVLLFSNNKHRISVCTSQNQTRGNRHESGIITTDQQVYDTYNEAINKLINKSVDARSILG